MRHDTCIFILTIFHIQYLQAFTEDTPDKLRQQTDCNNAQLKFECAGQRTQK